MSVEARGWTAYRMEGAFQTLLEQVGEMGLNDGDFLRMNTLLKKAWDENKAHADSRIKTKTHADFGRISIALFDKDFDFCVRYALNSVEQTTTRIVESTRLSVYISYKLNWTAFHDGGAEHEITATTAEGRGGWSWTTKIRNIAHLIGAHKIIVRGLPFNDEIVFDVGSVLNRMHKTAKLEFEAEHEGTDGYEPGDYDLDTGISHIFELIDTYIVDGIKASFSF